MIQRKFAPMHEPTEPERSPRPAGVPAPEPRLSTPRRLGALLLDPDATLERKLFELITLAWGAVALLLIAPANGVFVSSGVRLVSTLIIVAFGAFSLVSWRQARRGRLWVTPFFFAHLLALDAIWFPSGGSTAATILFAFSLILLPIVFARGRQRVAFSLLIGLDVAALYALELAHPEWLVPHPSRTARLFDVAITTLVALAGVGGTIGMLVHSYREERRRLAEANRALERALGQVRTLEGLLPICAWCKKIRDDRGRWTPLETFVAERTQAKLTHGICPGCERKLDAEG
jgi:hypothetical protein